MSLRSEGREQQRKEHSYEDEAHDRHQLALAHVGLTSRFSQQNHSNNDEAIWKLKFTL